MPPTVSIIIPVYNSAGFIESAIDSVLEQDFKDYEIIVVDDGSTDNINDVMSRYTNNDLVRFFHQSNKGPGGARNLGIKASKGEFIAFLDADDILEKNSLHDRVDVFKRFPEVSMVFTDMKKVLLENGQKRVIRENDLLETGFLNSISADCIRLHSEDIYLFSREIWYELVLYCFIWTGTVMIRREVFKKVGFFKEELNIAEDHDLWIRIAQKHNIAFRAVNTAVYYFHADNITRDIPLYYNCSIHVRSPYLDSNNQLLPEYRNKLRKKIALFYFIIGYHYFDRHRHCLAKKEFTKAITYNPLCLKYYLYLLLSIMPHWLIEMLRNIKRICSMPVKVVD